MIPKLINASEIKVGDTIVWRAEHVSVPRDLRWCKCIDIDEREDPYDGASLVRVHAIMYSQLALGVGKREYINMTLNKKVLLISEDIDYNEAI